MARFWGWVAGVGIAAQVSLATAAATADDAEIQRWINQHALRANSVELPAARYRVVGDLDGDGRTDIALLYTLKARNGGTESRHLAAFKRVPDKSGRRGTGYRYHAQVLVAGPGAGEAVRLAILNRVMVVDMLTFGAGDAACCPTRAATRRYRLAARGLTLVAPAEPRRAR